MTTYEVKPGEDFPLEIPNDEQFDVSWEFYDPGADPEVDPDVPVPVTDAWFAAKETGNAADPAVIDRSTSNGGLTIGSNPGVDDHIVTLNMTVAEIRALPSDFYGRYSVVARRQDTGAEKAGARGTLKITGQPANPSA